MTIDKHTSVLVGLIGSSLALLPALYLGYDLPGGHGSLRTLTRGVNSGNIPSRKTAALPGVAQSADSAMTWRCAIRGIAFAIDPGLRHTIWGQVDGADVGPWVVTGDAPKRLLP